MKAYTRICEKADLMRIDPVATGRQLRSMRKEHHLTQEKLSELFDAGGDPASRNAIGAWEAGKRLPTLSHAVFLAELYNCTLDELILSYRRSGERDMDDGDQLVPFLRDQARSGHSMYHRNSIFFLSSHASGRVV